MRSYNIVFDQRNPVQLAMASCSEAGRVQPCSLADKAMYVLCVNFCISSYIYIYIKYAHIHITVYDPGSRFADPPMVSPARSKHAEIHVTVHFSHIDAVNCHEDLAPYTDPCDNERFPTNTPTISDMRV